MACINHQGHGQCLQRIKCPKKHIDRYKFYRTGKNSQAHQHRIPEAKAGHVHIDAISQTQKPEPADMHVNAVSHAEKQKSGKNGNGMGEGAAKRPLDGFSFTLHKGISQ